MRDRQTCVGCGKQSPETETNYTLISAQFGWRLTRYKNAEGTLIIEWRCPTCWREFKRARGASAGDGTDVPPSSSGARPSAVVIRSPAPGAGPLDALRTRRTPPPGEPAIRRPTPAPAPVTAGRAPAPPPSSGRSGPPPRPSPTQPPPLPTSRPGRGTR